MLRKFLAGVLTGVMLFSSTAFAQSYNFNINSEDVGIKIVDRQELNINDDSLASDYELYFIPAKAFYEKLGFSSKWNAETKTVTFNNGDYEISFTTNADYYNVNGSEIEVCYPAKIVAGCIYVQFTDALDSVEDFYALSLVEPMSVNGDIESLNYIALNDEEYEEYNRFYQKYIAMSLNFANDNTKLILDCLDKYNDKYDILESEDIEDYADIFKNKFTEEEQKEYIDTFKAYLENSEKFSEELSQLEVPKVAKADFEHNLGDLKKANLLAEEMIDFHNKVLNGESYDEIIEKYEKKISEFLDTISTMLEYYDYDYEDDYDYDSYDIYD